MKRLAGLMSIVLALVVCAACAPPPIKLTDEQIRSVALDASDLPAGYGIDNKHTGMVTYQSLVDEGSVQTAEYVKSVEGVQIYRTAFERTASTAGPLVMWSWVLVYKDEMDAHGYFVEHSLLYPETAKPRSPFSNLGQESTVDYSETSSGAAEFELYHVILRQHNIIIYFAPLYETGTASENEVQSYAKLLEAKLLSMLRGL